MSVTAIVSNPVAADENGLQQRLEHAFIDACLLDVMALKPGNVGVHADGHGMEVLDFVRSARAAAPAIAGEAASVGERIHRAVAATRAAVGTNTNLGIVLLVAPMAHAVHAAATPLRQRSLSEHLAPVLAGLTVADAERAFEAIRLANPGGLGASARHDVHRPAQVTLLEAMREAADRDSIARQYVTGYADVVRIGLPRLAASRARGRDRRWAAAEVYLAFLSSLPDTHVARKFGWAEAEALREAAQVQAEAASQAGDTRTLAAAWGEWDAALKARGLNPGTSADLAVATLFWSALLERDW